MAEGRNSWRRVAYVASLAEREPTMSGDGARIDPNRLTIEQAAKLLSAAAKVRVPPEQIAADLEAGAPRNDDGTISLVRYAAWILKEMGRGK